MISSAWLWSGASVRSAERWICFLMAATPAGSPVHHVRRGVKGEVPGPGWGEDEAGVEREGDGEKSFATAPSAARKRMAASSPALPKNGRPPVKCFRRNWLMAL